MTAIKYVYDPATGDLLSKTAGSFVEQLDEAGEVVATDFEPDDQATATLQASDIVSEATAMLNAKMMKTLAETAELTDRELALAGAAGLLDEWAAGVSYKTGKRLVHAGQVYVVVQDHTAQEHQPPGAAGMLAVYRPVGAAEEDGSLEHPFTLVAGMEGIAGKFYSHDGAIWQCLRAMQNILAHWFPGMPGMDSFWRDATASPAMAMAASPPELYVLNATGTYHLETCGYAGESGEHLTLAQIAEVNPAAKPCGRCGPPALAPAESV